MCDGQVAMDAAMAANATSDMNRHTHRRKQTEKPPAGLRQLCHAAFPYLFRVVPRVIPGCPPVVVVHEERPPGLRVDLDFPSEGKRVVVIVGHRRQYRRLRLHAVHLARLPGY